MPYEFPVTNKFHAREVTEIDFEIEPDSEAYVDLDPVRGTEFRDHICYSLNIDEDKLATLTQSHLKIIFSGHKGSGKTLELKRLSKYLDHPDRYFSVFIELEKEFELSKFQSEYLFVAVIAKLIAKIQERQLNFSSGHLDDIAQEWLSDREVEQELRDQYQFDVSGEASAGIQLFNFFGLKSGLKALFTAETKTSEKIKTQIRKEPMKLIGRFNQVLADLREYLNKKDIAQDILFIIDGSEKLPYEVNRQLFIKDAHIIKEIESNMIIAVPIYSQFDIQDNPSQHFTNFQILPMVRLEKADALEKFSQIITKRIDFNTFFEREEVLNTLVHYSGGTPQQLLRLVNTALIFNYGNPITETVAEQTIYENGRRLYETLNSDHLKIIESGDYNNADQPTLELLFWLAILKYNGKRELNPLLKRYLEYHDGNG